SFPYSRSLAPPHLRLSAYPAPPTPLSFPTRRSSDLMADDGAQGLDVHAVFQGGGGEGVPQIVEPQMPALRSLQHCLEPLSDGGRSEEHTSELQSRFDLVCRLLLEKKNTSVVISCHVE